MYFADCRSTSVSVVPTGFASITPHARPSAIGEEGVPALKWRAALSTAAVVDRLGHRDLTVRLVQWVTRTFPGDVRPMFGPALVALGFSIADPAASDLPLEDIDRLMDEVLAITDRT